MYVYTTTQGLQMYLLEVTKQQICMKYCSSVLYYQLQGSWSNVGHCVNLWFTFIYIHVHLQANAATPLASLDMWIMLCTR